jgi:L-ascorbate metabolism protein UlaG (beta-lactamase superfamily)
LRITQLRNATVVVHVGEHRILVDPMLSPRGHLPTLKWLTGRRRKNPLVELPANGAEHLEQVTHCLITHCQKGHFDHLDRAGARWLRERQTLVFCMPGDANFLRKRGLNVHVLGDGPSCEFLRGSVTPIKCVHGRGMIGKFMAHGYGYVIDLPGEPKLYLAGDTLLTDQVRRCLGHLQPDVSVLPAGGAAFDLGQEILMGLEDILEAAALTKGLVVANHLEALDHCPVTRIELLAKAAALNLGSRILAPQDGETLRFELARDGRSAMKVVNERHEIFSN